MNTDYGPLLGQAHLGQPQELRVAHNGIEYPGEVVVAEEWREEWGAPLEDDRYFRVVLFLGVRQVTQEMLRDPRVGVCLPELGAVAEASRLGQEQRALRETRTTYLPDADAETLRLVRALEGEETVAAQRALQAYLRALVQGRVVAPRSQARVQDVAAEPGTVEELVKRIALWLLAGAYPSLPVDSSTFPTPLTAAHVATLYAALAGQRRDPEAQEVAQGFGPGLGLCDRGDPFTPTVASCPALALVRRALEEGDGRTAAGPLLRGLAHEQGLTYPLATLCLIVSLLGESGNAELTLVPGHPFHLVDGAPLGGDVLLAEVLPDLVWPSGLRDWVRVLRPASLPTWESLLPWVQVFLPEAGRLLAPREEAEQERFLAQQLEETEEGVRGMVAGVQGLAAHMRVPLPPMLQEMGSLAAVCRARALPGLWEAVRSTVGAPSALRRMVDTYRRARQVTEAAPEFYRVHDYLRECPDMEGRQDIALERQAMLSQFDLSGLVQNPSLWGSIQSQFGPFQKQYGAAYTLAHQQHHARMASLQERLTLAEAQASALEQFNTLAELGPPLGENTPQRVRALLPSLRPCPVGPHELELTAIPVCERCRLQPGAPLPEQEVEALVAEVRHALAAQGRRLSSAAIQRILARADEPLTDKFVKIVQSCDLSSLYHTLDDQVMEFLRRFLREA